MISIFRRKPKVYGEIVPITVDMHSHLLPGIDDGCQNFEQSVALVKFFKAQGYQKLILTPHIMGDFYQNTPEIIFDKLAQLREILHIQGIEMELEAAAEYYLDESFIARLEKGEELLSFGSKKYVLFETSYINPTPYLNYVIFTLISQGYTPVLAHPERYVYLFDDFKKLEEIHEKGALLQINMNSLAGYYSKQAQKVAEKLIDSQKVSFLASDCHHDKHARVMLGVRDLPYYKSGISLGLLNNTL
jgi:tyrosine-protein phosphatase YwqE